MKLTSFLSSLKVGGSGGEEKDVWEEHWVHLERGKAAGFGFAVSSEGEGVVVEDVVEGGSAKGRVRVGDQIVGVGNISLDSLSYSEAIEVIIIFQQFLYNHLQVLRGTDSSVRLTIRRLGPAFISPRRSPNHLLVSLFRRQGCPRSIFCSSII